MHYNNIQGGDEMSKNELLKRLIKESGFTQKDFAVLADITPEYLSQLINGKYTPSFHLAYKIADLLGTTVDHLFLQKNST